MRGIAYIQLTNIQDIIHKSDFEICRPVTIFNFLQNLAENQYIPGGLLRILVPYQILAPLSHFWKKNTQITTAHLELINFQDPTHKSDFDTYYARTAFDLPEKLVESKMQMFLEY